MYLCLAQADMIATEGETGGFAYGPVFEESKSAKCPRTNGRTLRCHAMRSAQGGTERHEVLLSLPRLNKGVYEWIARPPS
jgi:hypothetical protein